MDKLSDFLSNRNNRSKIRYMGFSMGVVVMLAGIGTAIVATLTGTMALGIVAAGVITLGFVMFPVTDINFSNRY